jgi:hypothetical protein
MLVAFGQGQSRDSWAPVVLQRLADPLEYSLMTSED